MIHGSRQPIGVILAGGSGRRIGGSKPLVELCGRPLIAYPLKALQASLADVAVIAKADTALPSLPGVTLWVEPQTSRHPLVGILQALVFAAGRPVLVCAADLPFVQPSLIERLLSADPGGAPAIVPSCDGAPQPLLALYLPSALDLLNALPSPTELPLREAVAAIGPRLLEVAERESFFNVNSPDDLLQAAAMLDRRA